MKLTKFEHSCFTLEKDGQLLVIDPGNWTNDFAVSGHIAAIILTHEHADHFDMPLLHQILNTHPDTPIIAPKEMTRQLAGLRAQLVTPGDRLNAGPFSLEFFGGQHAVIHLQLESVANVGVLINGSFYYPGDSFVRPNVPVRTLALPVVAPWLKISEPIDFMIEIGPEFAFPVHDHIASSDGKSLVDHMVGRFAEQNGIRYQRITDSIEVAS